MRPVVLGTGCFTSPFLQMYLYRQQETQLMNALVGMVKAIGPAFDNKDMLSRFDMILRFPWCMQETSEQTIQHIAFV